MEDKFRIAKIEIGDNEFNERYRKVFNQMVLDYVETIVLNLPNLCQCDCEYCIDKYLRTGHIDATKFLIRCRELLMTFPNAKNVCITDGMKTISHWKNKGDENTWKKSSWKMIQNF